jgi:hypothetical protein
MLKSSISPRRLAGQAGWDWLVTVDGRVRAEGWTAGQRRLAEFEVALATARLTRVS